MRSSCRPRARPVCAPPGPPAWPGVLRARHAIRRAGGRFCLWGIACLAMLVAGCTDDWPVPPFEPPPGMTPNKLVLTQPENEACGSAQSRLSRLLAQEVWSCDERHPESTRGGGRRDLPHAGLWRACRAHDICYSTPGTAKSVCDDVLYEDLVTECEAAFSPPLSVPDLPFWKGMFNRRYQSDRWVGSCRRYCIVTAKAYRRVFKVFKAGSGPFREAHQEAAKVLGALREALGPGKMSAIEDRLTHLVGEACFTFNDAGVCDTERATRWILDRVAEVDGRCRALGQPLESCAVYHCTGFEAVWRGEPPPATGPAGQGCQLACYDGVLVNACG